MRTCPNWASLPICLTRSCRDKRALFSWPEYVWTTYHFIAIDLPSAPVVTASIISLPVDHARGPGPHGVEEAQEQRRDDGRHDDDDRRAHGLLPIWPGHLAQLGGHLVGEGEHFLIFPGDVGRDARDDRGAEAHVEIVRLAEIAPRPVAALGEQPGQQDAGTREQNVDPLAF